MNLLSNTLETGNPVSHLLRVQMTSNDSEFIFLGQEQEAAGESEDRVEPMVQLAGSARTQVQDQRKRRHDSCV